MNYDSITIPAALIIFSICVGGYWPETFLIIAAFIVLLLAYYIIKTMDKTARNFLGGMFGILLICAGLQQVGILPSRYDYSKHIISSPVSQPVHVEEKHDDTAPVEQKPLFKLVTLQNGEHAFRPYTDPDDATVPPVIGYTTSNGTKVIQSTVQPEWSGYMNLNGVMRYCTMYQNYTHCD